MNTLNRYPNVRSAKRRDRIAELASQDFQAALRETVATVTVLAEDMVVDPTEAQLKVVAKRIAGGGRAKPDAGHHAAAREATIGPGLRALDRAAALQAQVVRHDRLRDAALGMILPTIDALGRSIREIVETHVHDPKQRVALLRELQARIRDARTEVVARVDAE